MSEIPKELPHDGNDGSEISSSGLLLVDDFVKEVEEIVVRTFRRQIEPNLEPMIRRVVNELWQQKNLTSINQNSGEGIVHSQPRKLELKFQSKLHLPVLTRKPIKGEDGNDLIIGLFDEKGLIVKSGLEASAKVEIVVLQVGDQRELKSEKFNQKIVREREGNKPIITGDVCLSLNEGTGQVGKICFTHSSNWMKKCEFMMGARLVDNFDGIIVTEAKSQVFTLQDYRSKSNEKHHPPSLSDDVWRLVNVGKGGHYFLRFKEEKIATVKQLLTQYFTNVESLREVLRMPDEKLNETIKHGLKCEGLDKHLYYPPGSQQQTGIVLNIVGQLLGVHSKSHFVPIDKLPETERDNAQKLVALALRNWTDVAPYNESSTHLAYPDSSMLKSPYDHTQPSTSAPNVISSDIFTGTCREIAGQDHTQPHTSFPNTTSSSYIVHSSNTNTVYNEMQLVTAPVGIVLPNVMSHSSIGRITGVGDSGLFGVDNTKFDDVEYLPECFGSAAQNQDPPMSIPEFTIQGIADHEKCSDPASDIQVLYEDGRFVDKVEWSDPASIIQEFDEDEQLRFPSKNRITKHFNRLSSVLGFSPRKKRQRFG